jgi:16S rRNA G527 N7-methylase RsmG
MKPEIIQQVTQELLHAMLGPSGCDPLVQSALVSYVQSVAKFGAGADLVGAKTETSLCEIVLADAIEASKHRACLHSPLYEVGAGGAPLALVLAVMFDGLSAELVEPRQKRATFLRLTVGAQKLAARVQVKQMMLDVAALPAAVAGTSIARAVWAPNQWLSIAETLTRPGATVLVTTTPEHLEQVAMSAPATLREVARSEYELPFSHAKRVLFFYRKSGDTVP